MLRWCQSTVRALDGCGTSTIGVYSFRLHSSAAARRTALCRHEFFVPTSVTHATVASSSSFQLARRIAGITRTFHITGSTLDLEAAIPVLSGPPAPVPPAAESSSTVDSDAVAVLSNFLSPQNLHSQNPHKLSVQTLTTLYATTKAHDHLRRLSSKQLTELISLLGSLSLPRPRNPCIYLSKLVSHIYGEADDTPHWTCVLEVARAKETVLGQTLNGTDRYWVMRAQLTRVVLAEGESLEPDDPRLRALSKATMQYLRIWRHTSDPEIHMPYFQALLSLRSPEHVATLVQRLCKVLELHANPHSRLLDFLWQILLRHGHQLNSTLKARILSMLTTRLSHFPPAPLEKARPSASKAQHGPAKRHKPTALGTPELSTALGSALFPTYVPTTAHVPLELRRWAAEQTRRAFTPEVAICTRWGDLLLLAIYKAPHLSVSVAERVSLPPEVAAEAEDDTGMTSAVSDWRPVLVLAALEQTLRGDGGGRGGGLSAPESREGIQDIIRPLWRMWRATRMADGKAQFVTVTRAVVATFFRVAGQVLDGPLTEGCYRFCIIHGLFGGAEAGSAAERSQVADLCVAYALASAVCQGTNWRDVLETWTLPGNKGEVVQALLWHFLPRDVHAAYGVYTFAKEHGYRLSDGTIHALSLALVSSRTWHFAVPFLDHPDTPRERTEELLVAILRGFQLERREYVDPPQVKALGSALLKLYTDQAPNDCFKYPIRFFFPIMIASGHPAQAISIVEAIHAQAPSFFTTRFLLRLMRTLVRYRHLHLTDRLLQLLPASPTRAADDFRRKLTLSLARAGAHSAARKVYRSGIRRKGWRTARESMARAVAFRVRSPSSQDALRILPILARNPTHGPTIKYAAILLVRANRTYAARKVLERAQSYLDRKTSTAIGNTILHGFLKRHRLRNGRLVRHTLRTKEMLEKRCGFQPDRVTINIIIKGVLRWRHAIGSTKVKVLFDHMVRCGYPASARWCTASSSSSSNRGGGAKGVPFSTPLATPAFSVPALEEAISFERHVRPMYKMFVKAFYARRDGRAARTVLGILKEEEVMAMRKREERNRARKMGLVKKKMRERERERKMDNGKDGAR